MNVVTALEPGQPAYDGILSAKTRVRSLAGEQLYIGDEPHVTLSIADYLEPLSFVEKLADVVANISLPSCSIIGWRVFKGDAVTGRHTLTCELDHAAALQAFQLHVLDSLNPHRATEPIARYRHFLAKKGTAEEQDVRRYGFPFVGPRWHPHIGIASIAPAAFGTVWAALEHECPKAAFRFSSVNLYRLDPGTEKLTLLRRILLK